jgi:hypothetical protein
MKIPLYFPDGFFYRNFMFTKNLLIQSAAGTMCVFHTSLAEA